MNEQQNRARIDALIAAFFAAFDNRAGAVPRIEPILDCFTHKAVIVRHSRNETAIYTPLEFAQPRIELLTQGSLCEFHEYETSASTAIFDGIATRTSRYSKRGLLNGNDYSGAGTKCFQFVELDCGWRICALAWVDDTA